MRGGDGLNAFVFAQAVVLFRVSKQGSDGEWAVQKRSILVLPCKEANASLFPHFQFRSLVLWRLRNHLSAEFLSILLFFEESQVIWGSEGTSKKWSVWCSMED